MAQHLVDPLLFPELNSAFVLRIYELVMERNRDNPAKLKEHRGNFIRAFTVWVEEEFLPPIIIGSSPSGEWWNIRLKRMWIRRRSIKSIWNLCCKRPS